MVSCGLRVTLKVKNIALDPSSHCSFGKLKTRFFRWIKLLFFSGIA